MKVAAVVPAYRCKEQIVGVLRSIGPEVERILLIDDACPEKTGEHARANVSDTRLKVVFRESNGGVGAAVKTGIRAALDEGAELVIKLDGDGQMPANLIPRLLEPLRQGLADVAKGNRFWDARHLHEMPWVRLIGNSVLSFLNKAVSGYWSLMDPTNGFIAWHRSSLELIRLERLSDGYFFESDLLYELGLVRAVIHDLPMRAQYGDERSGLKIWHVILTFPLRYARRLFSRICYRYFLRDFNMGSLALLIGGPFTIFGFAFGISAWLSAAEMHIPSTSGTVMLAALPTIIGIQLLGLFCFYDVLMVPKTPLQLMVPKE
jgi:glycosyltransferase involved in cell wall biosynthesis